MGIVCEYQCINCGYAGEISKGPNMFSLTEWTTKVCEIDRVFVQVDTKFWNANGESETNPGEPVTDEELESIKANFNKCPIHHDRDLSRVKYDKKSRNALCPKCGNEMDLWEQARTD